MFERRLGYSICVVADDRLNVMCAWQCAWLYSCNICFTALESNFQSSRLYNRYICRWILVG